ncbi:hypothetical protein UFOVP184_10 [uncultured Caudovirales phage]|uniref:Uncharacterized protein n=1 Tax=uncultured Caudovirales phage TaxID=2100421 RepID=A0A6J7WHK9_9CAUD|nr:hypothetical protein UFOVP184_10 [uncultured Caudovirales phage]
MDNEFWRRLVEMERRQQRAQDMQMTLEEQSAVIVNGGYRGGNFVPPWRLYDLGTGFKENPDYPWKIKSLKAQASFDTPAIRFQQAYYATVSNEWLGYFNMHDGTLFEEMRREKSHMVSSYSYSSAQWGHIDYGGRVGYTAQTASLIQDRTCWPWPFDPEITQPGVNWSNIWYATYLNDPAPDWYTMGGSSAGWPPSQPNRPVSGFSIDWFGADPSVNYSTQFGSAPRGRYLHSIGGITPSYNWIDHTVTWRHGGLYRARENTGSVAIGQYDISDSSAFCGKVGVIDVYNPSIGRDTRFRSGAIVTFNNHSIPAGRLWQGSPGTVTIPATFTFLEIGPLLINNGTTYDFHYVQSPASVKLTWE